jgi:serine/threonine protein phosphatase PrpC
MTPTTGVDPLLLANPTQAQCHALRAGGGAAVAWAAPKPGAGASEDALLVLPVADDAAVLAVADGMGGVPGGGDAAARAVAALERAVEEGIAAGLPLRAVVINGIEQANESVLAMGTGAATTLAVAEIAGGLVRAYNVGDSEVMVIGQRGRLKLRTVSHSPVGFAVQAGLVDHDEALHHEDRHLVSNFLGSRDMRIEVGSPVRLAPRDTVLVCSDGLVDNLRLAEITEAVRCGRLDAGLRRLGQAAEARMVEPEEAHPSKPDDLSIVAYREAPGRALMSRLPLPRQLELAGEAG